MNVQKIVLDLSKQQQPGQMVRIGQGDKRGTVIQASIYDNGVAADLAGMTARFEMRLPKGLRSVQDSNCTISGNAITYTVDEAHCAAIAGYTDEAYFSILSGSTVVYSTARFRILVLESVVEGTDPAADWNNVVEDYIAEWDETYDGFVADTDAKIGRIESALTESVNNAIANADTAAENANDAATSAENRIEAAIDAVGDISELAVPLMSADVRGGAKLQEKGGLVLTDGALGVGSLVQSSDGTEAGPIQSLEAYGHADQNGEPSPENPVEIEVVRGRNLWDPNKTTAPGGTVSNGEYIFTNAGTIDNRRIILNEPVNIIIGSTYTLSCKVRNTGNTNITLSCGYDLTGNNWKTIGTISAKSTVLISYTFTVADFTFTRFVVGTLNSSATYTVSNLQLELGSEAHPYIPYGDYVGMDVYDAQSQHLSTIPIPLPSRGWVGSLPDGTADKLTIDGAGKVEWEKSTEEVVFNGSNNETWGWGSKSVPYFAFASNPQVPLMKYTDSNNSANINPLSDQFRFLGGYSQHGADVGGFTTSSNSSEATLAFAPGNVISVETFKTWLQSNPVTVLYPLATPVTESLGYIDLPDIPVGAAISIPELDGLSVDYWIDSNVMESQAQQNAKIESELDGTNAALVDLTSEVVSLQAAVTSRFSEIDTRLDSMAKAMLFRDSDGYYNNQSITAMLACRFDHKVYGFSEPKTTATALTKTGANAGLPNPTLGTAEIAGSSVYREKGPFQWYAAKGNVDADGVPHMKVIKGVDSDDDWDDCDENVWSLRPLQWHTEEETANTYEAQLSDTWHQGLKLNPNALLPDGTLRPYMIASRYPLAFENGVGVSKSGLKCYGRDVSHNSLITKLAYATTGYSGKSVYEQWYNVFMFRMIYGTKNSQSVMYGCAKYNLQYYPTVAETGVKRVILSNANAANLVVGSTMMLGNQSTVNNDRNNANAYNVFDGLKIEKIETYDSSNMAVYFATDTEFDTTTAYLLSTAPWHSGSCDALDWDGTPTADGATSGKEPMFFQGCELMHGATETLGCVIIGNDGLSGWMPYINWDSKNEAMSVTSDYVSSGASLPTDTADSWKYPKSISDHGGLMFGTDTGGSQSAGVCDGHYTNKLTATVTREWLSGGHLGYGGLAGLSFVGASRGLGHTYWHIWSRLSGVGRSLGVNAA